MKAQHWLTVVLIAGICMLQACSHDPKNDVLKWHITLDKDDKKPYGAYLAYQSLQYYFPGTPITSLSRNYRYSDMSADMMQGSNGRNVLVLVGLDFKVSDDEWKRLLEFADEGNEIVIFCSALDSKIEGRFNCVKQPGSEQMSRIEKYNDLSENRHSIVLANSPATAYGYNGRYLRGHFYRNVDYTDTSSTDTNYIAPPDTLGYLYETTDLLHFNVNKISPDFLRFAVGEGHITLHAAPLVMSNYFLLQPGNIDYLTGIWRTLPEHINKIYWQDYYKRSSSGSSFGILWRYPATRWALIVCLILICMYLLFQAKRRQRQIPVIASLKNDSVSFVETVGRLYYNKGNHANLADKMIQQYLEWVRMHYYLNTNLLSEEFTRQLVMKSGQPEAMVRQLIEMISEVRTGSVTPDDAYLYQLYRIIQQFYKNER